MIDTVACLLRIKKQCGEYLLEAYDLMEDMSEWLKQQKEGVQEQIEALTLKKDEPDSPQANTFELLY